MRVIVISILHTQSDRYKNTCLSWSHATTNAHSHSN